jgi:hypothetical protein
MAYSLSGERPSVPAFATTPIAGFFNWLAKRRARRAQRLMLSRLLEYDATMLDDLGLNRQDLIESMKAPPDNLGEILAASRADNSRNWRADR